MAGLVRWHGASLRRRSKPFGVKPELREGGVVPKEPTSLEEVQSVASTFAATPSKGNAVLHAVFLEKYTILDLPNPPNYFDQVIDENGMTLRKARILDTETTTTRRAQSSLMAHTGDIHDEEITRAGLRLRLLEQRVRTPDGRAVVRRGREKRAWGGEASSGLRFAYTTPRA